jgi:hypothetical protein
LFTPALKHCGMKNGCMLIEGNEYLRHYLCGVGEAVVDTICVYEGLFIGFDSENLNLYWHKF